jgi:GNAT superfamily N-acetyltransferase
VTGGGGVRIRPLVEADLEAVATLHVRGWQWAYAGIMPQVYLDSLTVADNLARRRRRRESGALPADELVAERDGVLVGWAAVGPYREDPDGLDRTVGELYAIYAHPDAIGTGVGRALMAASLDLARAAGYPEIRLWVLEGNHRARRFYEKAGFAADGARAYYEREGVRVPEIRYARSL